MNISNYYWYFESAIPPRICDLIVKYGKAEKKREIMAITGGFGRDRDLNKQPLNKDEIKNLQKKRDSNIVWMNDRWIYKEIQPYIHQANQNAGWNFEWDWSESCQFTKYGVGQYYGWHCDSWVAPNIRKPNEQGVYPPDSFARYSNDPTFQSAPFPSLQQPRICRHRLLRFRSKRVSRDKR